MIGEDMEDFKIIYKILQMLEKNMGNENFDIASICSERLKIPYSKWEAIMIMLQDSGYIKGLITDKSSEDIYYHIVEPIRPVITIKGLEYLEENSMMKKASELLKTIGEII